MLQWNEVVRLIVCVLFFCYEVLHNANPRQTELHRDDTCSDPGL